MPTDPFLVGQRSQWACFNENLQPHGAVDTEAVGSFFDEGCVAGAAVDPTQRCLAATAGCHCTVSADVSCLDALTATTGVTALHMTFQRMRWDEATAAKCEPRRCVRAAAEVD